MTENEQELTLLIEYFKSLREEIHLRIREHTRLVWIKIVSLGAIISFLMERFYAIGKVGGNLNSGQLYFVWIIPLTAVIFDFLIAGNLRIIYNLGPYIKKYMEEIGFRKYVNISEFKFWEEGVAIGLEPKYHCYTVPDMIIIWAFTLASWAFSVVLRWLVGFNYYADIPIAVISAVFISFALLYLIRSITMERRI